MPRIIDTYMPMPPFHEWLEHRLEEVRDATTLTLVIARSGAAGVSRDDLRAVLQVSPETVEDLLRAVLASGQVAAMQVNGQRRYRSAG
jgi:hypothetical protein